MAIESAEVHLSEIFPKKNRHAKVHGDDYFA